MSLKEQTDLQKAYFKILKEDSNDESYTSKVKVKIYGDYEETDVEDHNLETFVKYDINIDHRPWGINGIDVTVKKIEDIHTTYEPWTEDLHPESKPLVIVVDPSQIKVEFQLDSSGVIFPERLELFLDSNFKLVPEKSELVF